MIRKSEASGRKIYTGTHKDLKQATLWARSMCHMVYGPVEGERRFRLLQAEKVLSLWAC